MIATGKAARGMAVRPEDCSLLRPLTLESRKKTSSSEAGDRCASAEQTLGALLRHVDPSEGLIAALQPAFADPSGLAHVYVAQHSFFLGTGRHRHPLCVRKSAGKGTNAVQAQTSALGEALERYSGIYREGDVIFRASYRALEGRAIHPNACMKFSSAQYRARAHWNHRESPYNWVPQRFDERREIEWVALWSLSEQCFKFLPAAYCYYAYPLPHDHDFCRPDSNGSASGNNLEEAILQGFFELVERDAIALWWYSRLRRPEVDLASFSDPYCDALQARHRSMGRDLKVLDITTDFRIPVFAAISVSSNPREGVMLGFGAHRDACIALLRALTEMNQFLPLVGAGSKWRPWVGAADLTGLSPAEDLPSSKMTDFAFASNDDLRDDVLACVKAAGQLGLEVLVLDQSRPDVELRVAKVLVPHMRPPWARFARGRLYHVPQLLGWTNRSLREGQLNPGHLVL